MQRIFISGIGVVSCLGNDRHTFWKNITSAQCGIDRLTEHDIREMEVVIGGEVRNLDAGRINVNDLVSTRKMDRASQFAVHAAHEALEDAGLPTTDIGENAAVIIGAGLAGLETYETQMEKLL
ncbi:MAG: beta-ketoacyl-[acyl-carrier-protein] synthase II, partial [Planctomycetota bacterium]